MSKKSFNLCIVLHFVNVNCPGVWICPKGMVYLDIWIFGQNSNTTCVEPKFPLNFNETFNFHKNLPDVSNLYEIQNKLSEKYMRIALVQVCKEKCITLATFNSSVDCVLYPTPNSRLGSDGETEILMKNEPIFPGTIAPKIVLITRTSITEEIHPVISDSSSEVEHRPNRMRKVHHGKMTNSQYSHRRDHEFTANDCNKTTDSETASQIYCQRNKKASRNNRHNECKCMLEKTLHYDHCRNAKSKGHDNNHNDWKDQTSNSELNCKSLTHNEFTICEITPKMIGKQIKAKLKLCANHCKCYKTKLNNCCCLNGNKWSSDEDRPKSVDNNQKRCTDYGEEPRKMNSKIKARLHLGPMCCNCGMLSCTTRPGC
ncbi:uncharacterized protein LOC126840840 [Adelges cooleyi]|uniref:uncharacterized protein LOC126840840 n=1 Tax=Adelges cooleyi TaxID=133065 RepID=UPI00217FB08A|nr:uncharacterized protein LOC126840840 [Adelges cooleyi]